jgi:PTS system ascorbate-specific IIC component
VGFIASFVGGLVGLATLSIWLGPLLGLALILPGLVPHFFTGGAAGVYGNATGGRRGAMLGGFINGLLITFLPALLLRVLGDFGDANTTFGDTDFGWFGILIGAGAGAGSWAGIALALLIGAALFGLATIVQIKVVDTGWDPAPGRAAAAQSAPASGTSNAASGAAYAKIPPPAGAPVPPPPPGG